MAYLSGAEQTTLTAKESIEMDFAERKFDKEAAYNIEIAKLNLETDKLEAKWGAILKIPITIIKLPVYCLFGIAVIFSVVTKQKIDENFWRLLK
jgi:hypothetical protein